MSCRHTIALCRDLFSEGHFEAISQIVEPLLNRGDIDPAELAVLGNLLAGATLVREGDSGAAMVLLASGKARSPIQSLGTAARAEAEVWKGWAMATSDTPSERALALSLLSESERLARDHHLTAVRCWASVGYGNALARAGATGLSISVLGDAERLAHALRETAALQVIEQIRSEFGLRIESVESAMMPSVDPLVIDAERTLALAARDRLPVLVTGETGVGKARIVELLGTTTGRPVHVLDCGAVEDDEGRLTDVLAEATENSILLLRDVQRLSNGLQVELANALSVSDAVAGKQVCATVASRPSETSTIPQLAPQLLRLISSVRIFIPPLRNRRDDVEVLVRRRLRSNRPGATTAAITDEALAILRDFSWPGNDAQLDNVIVKLSRRLAVDPSPVVDVRHMPAWLKRDVSTPGSLKKWVGQQFSDSRSLDEVLSDAEKVLIENTLEETRGHVTSAAELLGLSRQGLYKKMKRLQVDAGDFQVAEAVEQRVVSVTE